MWVTGLNYEDFLHNVNTRETIAGCIQMRTDFVRRELKASMEEGEIINTFTPEELSDIFFGSLVRDLLNRRIQYDKKTHDEFTKTILDKLVKMLRTDKNL